MNDFFPTQSRSQRIGIDGAYQFGYDLSRHTGFMFVQTPQQYDYGLDGYIEAIGNNGVSGKQIFVQLKSSSDAVINNKDIVLYFSDQKQFNYYSNIWEQSNGAIVFFHINVLHKSIHWVAFDPKKAKITKAGWNIAVPRTNELNAGTKQELLSLLTTPKDYYGYYSSNTGTGRLGDYTIAFA